MMQVRKIRAKQDHGFEKHSKHYVRDIESKEAKSQQAGEAAGMKNSGRSEKLNHGSRHGFEGLICGHLLSLSNDNAGNCERNMMSCSNLDEEKMGLDEICGSKGETQLFDVGWMKNG
jgi:hypothetical protein